MTKMHKRRETSYIQMY